MQDADRRQKCRFRRMILGEQSDTGDHPVEARQARAEHLPDSIGRLLADIVQNRRHRDLLLNLLLGVAMSERPSRRRCVLTSEGGGVLSRNALRTWRVASASGEETSLPRIADQSCRSRSDRSAANRRPTFVPVRSTVLCSRTVPIGRSSVMAAMRPISRLAFMTRVVTALASRSCPSSERHPISGW